VWAYHRRFKESTLSCSSAFLLDLNHKPCRSDNRRPVGRIQIDYRVASEPMFGTLNKLRVLKLRNQCIRQEFGTSSRITHNTSKYLWWYINWRSVKVGGSHSFADWAPLWSGIGKLGIATRSSDLCLWWMNKEGKMRGKMKVSHIIINCGFVYFYMWSVL